MSSLQLGPRPVARHLSNKTSPKPVLFSTTQLWLQKWASNGPATATWGHPSSHDALCFFASLSTSCVTSDQEVAVTGKPDLPFLAYLLFLTLSWSQFLEPNKTSSLLEYTIESWRSSIFGNCVHLLKARNESLSRKLLLSLKHWGHSWLLRGCQKAECIMGRWMPPYGCLGPVTCSFL